MRSVPPSDCFQNHCTTISALIPKMSTAQHLMCRTAGTSCCTAAQALASSCQQGSAVSCTKTNGKHEQHTLPVKAKKLAPRCHDRKADSPIQLLQLLRYHTTTHLVPHHTLKRRMLLHLHRATMALVDRNDVLCCTTAMHCSSTTHSTHALSNTAQCTLD